jgi:hypothetical protein
MSLLFAEPASLLTINNSYLSEQLSAGQQDRRRGPQRERPAPQSPFDATNCLAVSMARARLSSGEREDPSSGMAAVAWTFLPPPFPLPRAAMQLSHQALQSKPAATWASEAVAKRVTL